MLTYTAYHTAAEFDAGYTNSIDASVVDRWQPFFREESTNIAGRPRIELSYGPDPRNRIDLFPAPAAPPGAPVLIAIHGGLWFLVRWNRWMMHFLVPAFTAAGVHVACPSYRLAPSANLDEIVSDCRRAIAFLDANRTVAGSRLGPFSVLGHSAAGQLAAVMAATDWTAFDPKLSPSLVRSLIGVSGFYDIEPFELTGFQAQTRFTTEQYRRWNPVSLVRRGMPGALLITGAKESGLLHEMMDGYAALLRSSAVAVETRDAPDESHFSVLSRLGDRKSELHQRALAMVVGE
jgi:arylformamidase